MELLTIGLIILLLVGLYYLSKHNDMIGSGSVCSLKSDACCSLYDDANFKTFYRTNDKCTFSDNVELCGTNSIYFQNCEGRYLSGYTSGEVSFKERPDSSCCFEIVSPLYDYDVEQARKLLSDLEIQMFNVR